MSIPDGWCWETPQPGIFLFQTSFAKGQKKAASLRTWMPERSRGGRKSQTSRKFSLFWVKRRGGNAGTSRGRGKPVPGEQPKRSGLAEAPGHSQQFHSEAQSPGEGQELAPQRMLSQQLSQWKQSSPGGTGAAAVPSQCCTGRKIHAGHSRCHITFALGWVAELGRAAHPAVPDWEVTPSSPGRAQGAAAFGVKPARITAIDGGTEGTQELCWSPRAA